MGKTQDGHSEAFVDRSTITVIGNVRSALFQYVPQHHIDKFGTEWIVRSEQLSGYDCKKNAVHAIQLTIYLESGGTHSNDLPMAWGQVQTPWDQAAITYLCAWQGD